MHKISAYSSSESGIGEGDEGSAVEDFFNKFVPRLGSFAQHHDELLDDPTIDLDAMAIFKPPPQKKILRQQKQPQTQTQRHKMIMPKNKNDSANSNTDSGRDLSMDEIGVIVGQLKGGGPYGEKLIAIMLKGLEKTLSTNFYKLFLESGLPDNWCPIVKMNNDNTPFVEFLIKSDLSDQDPFSQLKEYSTEHMGLCKYVVTQLHQIATHRQRPQLKSASAYEGSSPHQIQQQPKQKQQSSHLQTQQQHQQRSQPIRIQQKSQQQPQSLLQPLKSQPVPQQHKQQSSPQQQKQPDLQQQTLSFGVPIACSTPRSQRQRILPPRACKSASFYRKQ